MHEPGAELDGEGRLGRYRLHQEVASGGMATVYLATVDTPEGFTKLVALKRIHDHLSRDPGFVEMFFDEARLAASIDHPHVCAVFDCGSVDGLHYIAMEYLAGETFRHVLQRVTRRPWAPEWPYRAAHLVAEACEGLHAAHELPGESGGYAGVVHRDVSPHNLFVTYSGVVKVVDFGIARAEGRSQHTSPGILKGKVAYVAPEQISGREVDRRADVWALGVTLWEMLTLRPLFRRSGPLETLGAVASASIPPPSAVQPRVPAALDRIVLTALAREPAARYPTARDLGRDLVTTCREQVELFDAVDIESFMADLFPEERARALALPRAIRERSFVRRLPRVEPAGVHAPREGILDGHDAITASVSAPASRMVPKRRS